MILVLNLLLVRTVRLVNHFPLWIIKLFLILILIMSTHCTILVLCFWQCCTGEHIWLRKVQRWEREMGKQTEGGRASEAVSLWGCKQREECGFHGNLRKAELWVSVPALTALHCTGPRLSVGSFLPSSPTLYFSLSISAAPSSFMLLSILTLHLVAPIFPTRVQRNMALHLAQRHPAFLSA